MLAFAERGIARVAELAYLCAAFWVDGDWGRRNAVWRVYIEERAVQAIEFG